MFPRPGLQLALAGLLGALCIACGEPHRDDIPVAAHPSATAATVVEKQPTDRENQPTSTTTGTNTPEPSDAQPSPATAAESNSGLNPRAIDKPMTIIGEEYPQTLDRDHPFQQLDRFCVPYPPVKEEVRDVRILVERGDYLSRIAERYEITIEELIRLNDLADPNLLFVGQELLVAEEGPVNLGPQAMGRGITEEAVIITHLRTRLEELTRLGFDVEAGNEVSMFEAFVQIVNEECGGLHGRQLDLRLVEVSALGGVGVDIDTLRNAACLEAAKTIPAVIVLNISGLAGTASRCIAVDNHTAYLSGDPQSSSIIDSADGRVVMDSFAAEQTLELMVATAQQAGWLDNRSLAVVLPDTPTQLQSAEVGLIDTLRRFGHDPTVYLVGCDGTVWCRTGLDRAVSKMATHPPDVLFPALNAVSFPELVVAMNATGMAKPLIIQSGFSQHGTDAAAELVLRYGGPQAALFYNGAVVVDHRDTGRHRLTGYTPPPFDEMCNDEYRRISGRLRADPFQRNDAIYETVVRACAMVRYVARALYDAGPNPTRRAVHEALGLLGDVDAPGMLGGSFGPGKTSRPDMVWVLAYEYPCAHGSGYQSSGDEPGGCLIPTSGTRLAGWHNYRD